MLVNDLLNEVEKVSVVLPNLDTPLHFLKERIISIQSQSYQNWECIVIDGFSTNGSWEFLQAIAKADKRFILYQKERKGIYNAWNCGVVAASGKYIYIAPSDDTMKAECLWVLADLLVRNSSCKIAQCALEVIDENGELIPERNWKTFYPGQFLGALIEEEHLRLAPYDGILHCALKTFYTSITQLLIAKTVFDEIGLFLTDKGTIADFEWGMRAGLVSNLVYTPRNLASWRIHKQQATTDDIQSNPRTYARLREFIDSAFVVAKKLGHAVGINQDELKEVYWRSEISFELDQARKFPGKIKTTLRYLVRVPFTTLKVILSRMIGRDFNELQWARKKIEKLNLTGNLIQSSN